MGYPDPKKLRIWAGLDPEADSGSLAGDTNPEVPLFNWDDLDIRSSPRVKKAPAYFAEIEISMYADLANQVIALRRARQKFLDYSGCTQKDIQWIKIIRERENVLFSSVKRVYTIEIQATKEAVVTYYRVEKRYKEKK